jgi:hypothetical protein
MNEVDRGELASRIAGESHDVIVKATRDGMFVLPLRASAHKRSRIT